MIEASYIDLGNVICAWLEAQEPRRPWRIHAYDPDIALTDGQEVVRVDRIVAQAFVAACGGAVPSGPRLVWQRVARRAELS